MPAVTVTVNDWSAVTVTVAFVEIAPVVAVTVAVPLAVLDAVNVVVAPFVGLKVPSVGVTVQVGSTVTALPEASAPVALRVTLPPSPMLAVEGEIVSLARVPEVAVAAWKAPTPSGVPRPVGPL